MFRHLPASRLLLNLVIFMVLWGEKISLGADFDLAGTIQSAPPKSPSRPWDVSDYVNPLRSSLAREIFSDAFSQLTLYEKKGFERFQRIVQYLEARKKSDFLSARVYTDVAKILYSKAATTGEDPSEIFDPQEVEEYEDYLQYSLKELPYYLQVRAQDGGEISGADFYLFELGRLFRERMSTETRYKSLTAEEIASVTGYTRAFPSGESKFKGYCPGPVFDSGRI
jgi:hypothetical protein